MWNQKFRDLNVWHKSMEFVEMIYKLTACFPSCELYGLSSQMRRSATSITLNIAEGSGAGSDAEFRRFLNISLRSAYETMCALEIAMRLEYSLEDECRPLMKTCDELSAMITGLKNSLNIKRAIKKVRV